MPGELPDSQPCGAALLEAVDEDEDGVINTRLRFHSKALRLAARGSGDLAQEDERFHANRTARSWSAVRPVPEIKLKGCRDVADGPGEHEKAIFDTFNVA